MRERKKLIIQAACWFQAIGRHGYVNVFVEALQVLQTFLIDETYTVCFFFCILYFTGLLTDSQSYSCMLALGDDTLLNEH